jgi:hypothetical protein
LTRSFIAAPPWPAGSTSATMRTVYGILDAHDEVRERRDQLVRPHYAKPELLATAPDQVWSWDITKLRGPRKWTYYDLCVVLDIYSRSAHPKRRGIALPMAGSDHLRRPRPRHYRNSYPLPLRTPARSPT